MKQNHALYYKFLKFAVNLKIRKHYKNTLKHSFSETVVFGAGGDYVVKELNADALQRLPDLGGDHSVGLAGERYAAGVVVAQYDICRSRCDRLAHYGAHVDRGRVKAAAFKNAVIYYLESRGQIPDDDALLIGVEIL